MINDYDKEPPNSIGKGFSFFVGGVGYAKVIARSIKE